MYPQAQHHTTAERREHLEALAEALADLVPALAGHPEFATPRAEYAEALGEARRLLAAGFAQTDLSALARRVPALFWLHKEWVPPLREVAPGRWAPPAWYAALEPLERRAVAAAQRLRVVGWY